MGRFLLTRVLQAILVLFCVATVVFFLDRVTGNPVAVLLPPNATVAQEHHLETQLGLNQPLIVQYRIFMTGLLHLNLGQSIYYQQPALSIILQRFPATVELACGALVFALIVSIPLGTLAAVKRGSAQDRILMSIVLLGQCAPTFWLGIVLILVFAIVVPIFPASGIGGPTNLILPSITLGAYSMAVIARLLRSSLLEVLGEDYIRTARAKGRSSFGVITFHAMRNALLPVTTVVGLEVGSLLGGAILTETVFAWPGLGQLTVQAIKDRDFPLVQAIVLFFATTFVVVNLFVDGLYALIDPRVRRQ